MFRVLERGVHYNVQKRECVGGIPSKEGLLAMLEKEWQDPDRSLN